ncbi:hypothetical protein [Streptomyces sp. NPDC006012]|uniref:hypothetical protein n=1 Tax=Streptomyces sp. NPDC006012 TaxID=3364739 RepID=UPI0036C34274
MKTTRRAGDRADDAHWPSDHAAVLAELELPTERAHVQAGSPRWLRWACPVPSPVQEVPP